MTRIPRSTPLLWRLERQPVDASTTPAPRSARPKHRWREALEAGRALRDDPQNSNEAVRFVDSLPGIMGWFVTAQFRYTRDGRALLARRPDLFACLSDRRRLEALPADSLGRAYLAFTERSNVSAAGLVDAFERTGFDHRFTGEWKYIYERNRVAHDLWHVALGYEADIVGEMAIAVFTFAQTGSLGLGVMTLGWLLDQGPFAGDHPALAAGRPIIRAGAARAARARFLSVAPWEALMARPLDEVRERLRVGPPPVYRPVRFADLERRAVSA